MTDRLFHICIGRQIGAGGLETACKTAKILNIKVFDEELIMAAAKSSGLKPEVFKRSDEISDLSVRGGIFGISSFMEKLSSCFTSSVMDSTELFKIQSDTIREIASSQSAVFVGRCADYILRDTEKCFSAFITASLSDRIERIKKSSRLKGIENLTDEKIAELLDKGDKKRAEYYDNYTFKVWGAAESYDICLNSTLYGTDKCAEMISDTVKEHFLND